MEIKVNEATPVTQTQATSEVKAKDDAFKFTLASEIEDHELQEKLKSLMGDIEAQGNRLAEHMDIRDMKKYRTLVKEFVNEVVNRSHKFSRENFLPDSREDFLCGIQALRKFLGSSDITFADTGFFSDPFAGFVC